MQVTASRVSPVEIGLKVSLPKERVTIALAKAYEALGKQAQIRGFRKGRVPLALLKKYFGERVDTDVARQLVKDSLDKAIAGQKVLAVGQPEITLDEPIVENSDWAYKVKLEVRPEIKDIVLDGIELKRTVYTVADGDVDHYIGHMRDEHSNLEAPEPLRPAQKGDLVTLDYDVTIAGAPRADLNTRNRTVEVGQGRLLDELDAGIPGMNVGETRDIAVTFNATHPRDDLRGKTATIRVTVSEIREKELPALDDEFAKDVGHENLAALRAKIRTDLETQMTETSDGQLREDAMLALVAKNPVVVPPSLVKSAVSMLAREIAQQHRVNGETLDAAHVIEEAKALAETRVRAGLVLSELAAQNHLEVSEEDLNNRIDAMAKATGKAAARLRAEHREPKLREALANAVLEDKVMSLLLSKVKITDVAAVMPTHDHDHHHA